MKILGREPALIIGAIVATISLGGTLGFNVLSPDQAGAWVIVVNGIAAAAMAFTVRPLQPGVYTYAVGAVVALATAYGLKFEPEQVNALNLLVVPILALLTRGQVSPIESMLTGKSVDPTPEAAAKDVGGEG